ncbi:hemin receptor [Fusobacterium necrophorum]|uniref:Hemin receptor n=4 Tax=Fusobacterium necrophorum TaxID=859 RepID=A0A4Q2KUW6_9FUSO|nr:ABC transporter substrate-binding protein [Fusobacterium necrophorum]AYZ74574.1 hemin receptor [Fusobacterium necrophorum]AZW09542.1 hemin receptor [Fusobacterium necrophorum subsp. necrophorum]KDE63711.1 hemin receptor [Fusobacterium necrophorum BL]KDE67073.1 hemin receptor [Fusobacterium necrophorum BFTR-1]KDE70549.1 hemin receptor [Fusobacterium necrophorum DAB]
MKKFFLSLLFLFSTLVFAKIPERAVSTAHFTTEILLTIGAEEHMVGTAYLDNPILPKLKNKFEKIPVLSNKYPTKEKFYSVKPDFVTGWKSLEKPKNLGPREELEANGVRVHYLKSLEDENIETLYMDILELGKIFGVEKNAQSFVEKMKEELKAIEAKIPRTKKKIFAYDSGEKQPFVIAGKGMGQFIIELAGGENITAYLPGSFGNSTWEKIIIGNPEYIIIVDYGDDSYESKVKYLKESSPIKNLKAVRKNRFIKVSLAGVSPGVRIVDEVKNVARALHGIDL